MGRGSKDIPWPITSLNATYIPFRLLAKYQFSPEKLKCYSAELWGLRKSAYNLTTDLLNDDRLGRVLERVADHRETIEASLVLGVIRRFKLDVSQVHYDISDVE